MSERAPRFIVAAAIKECGMVCFVPRPGRHHHVIREMAASGMPIPITGEQGFITNDELFVNRRTALAIALTAGQTTKFGSIELFSEDLW